MVLSFGLVYINEEVSILWSGYYLNAIISHSERNNFERKPVLGLSWISILVEFNSEIQCKSVFLFLLFLIEKKTWAYALVSIMRYNYRATYLGYVYTLLT